MKFVLLEAHDICVCVSGTKRPERLQHHTQFLTRHTLPVLDMPGLAARHIERCLPASIPVGLCDRTLIKSCLEYAVVKYRVPP